MSNSAFTPVVYPQVGGEKAPGLAAERARGYADGYSEGLRRAAATLESTDAERSRSTADAVAHGDRRVEQAVAALGRAVAAVNGHSVPVIEQADAILVTSALDLAEAVIGRELADGRVAAEEALRRALAELPRDRVATVLLHPADLAVVAEAAVPAGVVLEADAASRPGDAIVRFEDGWLDARIGAALERAREILTGDRP